MIVIKYICVVYLICVIPFYLFCVHVCSTRYQRIDSASTQNIILVHGLMTVYYSFDKLMGHTT